MQTRPALLLVLVLALLATGCANRPNLSSGITTETVLSLPPDLEVPAGDTALLYPLSASPEGAKAQVEALVGQPYLAETKRSEASRYLREALLMSPYITAAQVTEVRLDGSTLHATVELTTVYGKGHIYV